MSATELTREQRLERLLKAVQTDPGNWLHSDLQKAIEAEVGEAGAYRGLSDSGLSDQPRGDV